MKENIRIKSLSLENLKNVTNGTIKFPEYSNDSETISNIIGLYGQNGSGKTSVVKAFRIMQYLFLGMEFEPFASLMQDGKLFYSINLEFNIFTPNKEVLVNYYFKYNKLGLFEEKISYKSGDQKSTVSIDDETFLKNKIFTPDVRHHDFGVDTKELMLQYLTERRYNREKVKTSFFFSKDFKNTLIKNLKDEYFKLIISVMPIYAQNNFFIIEDLRRENIQNFERILPIGLTFKGLEDEDIYIDNHFSMGKNICNESMMNGIKQGIENINRVISTMIPNFNIEIKITKENKTPFGERIYEFELLAKRDSFSFPLLHESEGIKKLISLMASLIHMYKNENVFVVIDELDSGIYEYLIGELLQVLQEGAKGQLLFTSHNLRPLEVLNPSDIWFATTNPENRFIQFTGVKPNNNLRNMYLKTIRLGGQSEEVYKYTDQYKIRLAFAKAALKNE